MGLHEYHRGPRNNLSGRSKYKIGFEIEKIDKEIREHIDLINTLTLHRNLGGWALETDASLDYDWGFELVSPRFALYKNELIEAHFNKLNLYISADQDDSCGGHIHISSTTQTPQELLERVFLGYIPLLYVLYPSRRNNSYCFGEDLQHYLREPDRYDDDDDAPHTALAARNKTLEIRIFPSPRNVKSLLWRTKLIRWIIENPSEDPEDIIDYLVQSDSELYALLQEVYSTDTLNERIKTIRRVTERYGGGDIDEEKITRIINKTKNGK